MGLDKFYGYPIFIEFFVFGGYPEMNGMIWNDLGSSVHLRTADHFSRRMGCSVSASNRRLGDVKAFLSPSPRYSMPGGPQSLNHEQL